MGRHSAPDDDEDGDVLVDSAVAETGPELAAPRGRHARSDDDEKAESPAAEQAATVAPRVGKGDQSTAADLELLRSHADIRARVLAAALAPFVIYTVVMFVIDAMNAYFIWVWIPLVSAGVLAGSILDAAHRRRSTDQGTTSPSSTAP